MVNNNTKSSGVKPAGSPPALAGGSVPTLDVGNVSNPAGIPSSAGAPGGSGGSNAGSPAQVIPGATPTAKTGPRSRQSLKQALLALSAALPDARSLIAAIRVALVALFGKGNPVLENFGINAKPRPKLTTEQLAARKAKSAATRALRGTQGTRKKASVKFLGAAATQTSLSGVNAASGIPTSGGAPALPTGSGSSNAGAPAGATPSGGNTGSTGASKP